MILVFALSPKSLILALAQIDGQIEETRDATWQVGSGRSVALGVNTLMLDSGTKLDQLRRIVVVDQGGSYTSARTAFAFANAFAWIRQLPIILIQPDSNESFESTVLRAVSLPDSRLPITPSYETSK